MTIETPSGIPISTTAAAARPTNNGTTLRDIYTWKNPVVSGGVLVSGILVFLLLTYFEYNIVTLAARGGQLILGASGIYFTFVAKSNHPGGRDFSSYIQPISSSFANIATQFARDLHQAYTWQNRSLSLKLLATLQLLFWFANYFSFLTIGFIGFLVTMTIPLVYASKQKQIDAVINNLKTQIHGVLQNINSKLPPSVREYAAKVGVELPAPAAAAPAKRK